jgi:hypothetical protein
MAIQTKEVQKAHNAAINFAGHRLLMLPLFSQNRFRNPNTTTKAKQQKIKF